MPNKKSVLEARAPKQEGVSPEKDQFLDEPEEHSESKEELEQEMDLGEKDEDVYTEEGREKLLEDDDISDLEQAFAKGAEGSGRMAKCANCGKILSQEKDEIIETESEGELIWYCSDECAQESKD